MSVSTALLILAANMVALGASYVVAISAHVLWQNTITTDRGRALAAIAVGAIVVITAEGVALRLGGL